jgi:hypothetical protein
MPQIAIIPYRVKSIYEWWLVSIRWIGISSSVWLYLDKMTGGRIIRPALTGDPWTWSGISGIGGNGLVIFLFSQRPQPWPGKHNCGRCIHSKRRQCEVSCVLGLVLWVELILISALHRFADSTSTDLLTVGDLLPPQTADDATDGVDVVPAPQRDTGGMGTEYDCILLIFIQLGVCPYFYIPFLCLTLGAGFQLTGSESL